MDIKQKIVSFGQIDLQNKPLPDVDPGKLLLLPSIDLVLFPQVTIPIMLTRPESLRTVEYAMEKGLPIGIVCQKNRSDHYPTGLDDLIEVGVPAQILHVLEMGDDMKTAIVRAYPKLSFKLKGVEREGHFSTPLLWGNVSLVKETTPRESDEVFKGLVGEVKKETLELLRNHSDAPNELLTNLENVDDSELTVNMIATHAPLPIEQKALLLAKRRLRDRASELLHCLLVGGQMQSIVDDIRENARNILTQQQKNAFLQAQYESIRNELYGAEDDEIQELTEKADASGMPEQARRNFDKEIKKLSRFNPQSPDYAVSLTYLETLVDLPWLEESADNTDFSKAEEILEADHYGMKDVKERILQHIALTMKRGQKNSPILCLVGAPGVGKTSIGRSIANALGRVYQRVSLGGIHDESEIRGHRRTYIGAMPGRIITAIQNAKVKNPVLLLDEIDKVGSDFKGDPNAALLEVMDPEQHSHFHDNYVDVDYDLSEVFFIATANTLDTLPRPLLDRMEIIEMPGYLPEEKMEIAKRHLIPSIRNKHGLTDDEFRVSDEALEKIINDYTAESGVRGLEKKLAELSRKMVLRAMRGEADGEELRADQVKDYLGPEKYIRDDFDKVTVPGVVAGLAWTAVGGEILYIETALSPSKTEKLTLTGNLGNVMKESAMLSYQYLKANAAKYGIDTSKLDASELHVHVPEGAIPKDGPSAGITITTAIYSLLTGRSVRPGVAMTGEMTLRGKILPVGGIKEKILAAKRAGLNEIYLSSRNKRDINVIEPNLLNGMTFNFVDNFAEMMSAFSNE